jgi:hypothetical protein
MGCRRILSWSTLRYYPDNLRDWRIGKPSVRTITLAQVRTANHAHCRIFQTARRRRSALPGTVNGTSAGYAQQTRALLLLQTEVRARVPSSPNIAPSGNYPTPSRHIHIRNQLHRGRGLREKLRVAQLAFYGTQRFIRATKFSRACYWTQSLNQINSVPLSSHLF